MHRFEGKRVLVTAAAQGIGRACVDRLVAEGARVCATDLDITGLEGPSVDADLLDGTDSTACADWFAGRRAFDAVVHCIGRVDHGSVLDCPPADWARTFAVNVDSFYHVLRGCLPAMLAAGGGSIVCIASVASSLKGLPNRAVYGTTKAALIGLVKSVAIDFVGQGVRCNAVCPGTVTSPSLLQRIDDLGQSVGGQDRAMEIFTARQPMGRLGTPNEVAALCAYLASEESGFVTGQAYAIDGGITI